MHPPQAAGWTVPAQGRCASGFGPRDGEFHAGQDIAAPITGTPIVAASSGRVIDSGPATGYGLWIRIQHPSGVVTTYGHNNRNLVQPGQLVHTGQHIAEVGDRSESTGPHLHFQIETNGQAADPAPFYLAVVVVVGASGLSAQDFGDIDAVARDAAVGVAGNFSLTAALAQAAALLAARHLPSWEIIDYTSAAKPDAPSGTARELAERLAEVAAPRVEVSVDQTAGHVEARGATIAGTQVHSLRLPSFVASTEIVFALPDERLVIRHDAGSTATPYVAGTLLAVRHVTGRTGLVRGLDTLLLDGHS